MELNEGSIIRLLNPLPKLCGKKPVVKLFDNFRFVLYIQIEELIKMAVKNCKVNF